MVVRGLFEVAAKINKFDIRKATANKTSTITHFIRKPFSTTVKIISKTKMNFKKKTGFSWNSDSLTFSKSSSLLFQKALLS